MQQICISQSYSTGTSTGSTTTITLRKSNTQWNKIRGFSVDILELLNDRDGLIRFCRISRGNISKGVGLLNKGVKPMRKSPSLREYPVNTTGSIVFQLRLLGWPDFSVPAADQAA